MPPDLEMTAWLENERGEKIPIRGVCTFGRTSDNTVVIPMPKVSRKHAMIHEQGGEYWAVDLGSTNGFEINGARATHPVKLHPGDRLQMPAATFVFRTVSDDELLLKKLATENLVTIPDIRLVKCWLLIADIEGFTKLSQQTPADELAPLVGKWMGHCQEILREEKGVLAKFLGDSFLSFWTERDDTLPHVTAACRHLQSLQQTAHLPFRVVLHFGEVSFGGRSPDASSTMIGQELNFAFRLEKLASRLKLPWILSEPAASRLDGQLPLVSCGLHTVPDFPSDRCCFTWAPDDSAASL